MLNGVTAHLLLFGALTLAVSVELWLKKLPVWLCSLLLAGALLMRYVEAGWGEVLEEGLFSALVGTLLSGMVMGLFAWWGRGFGAGEVVLVAATGAFFRFPLGAAALVFISLAGAVLAVGALVLQRVTLRGLTRARDLSGEDAARSAGRRGIPYAVAVALGRLWTVWWDAGPH